MATVIPKQSTGTRPAVRGASDSLPTASSAKTTGADEVYVPIGADELDEATQRTASQRTRTIGGNSGHGRNEPPLPQGHGDASAIYSAGDPEPSLDHAILDKKDALARNTLVGAHAFTRTMDAHGHGVDHALHLTEQTGHAVETTHHLKHAHDAKRLSAAGGHHGGHSGGQLLGGVVSVALVPGATYFAVKDVKKAIADTTAENVTMAAGSVGFASSLTIGAAKSGMALAKVGARFTPGLNVAAAAADAVWAAGVIADSKASTSKKVAAGISALGSAVSATNIPIASQLGAAIATGGALLSTFL
ncbi:MAG: hypothetical protein IT383_15390 [Deltaproteobacteria bacterium]|jgi:hypothetical protein|nr:hypothetical protein [Deltaproteobacteria bacterium]